MEKARPVPVQLTPDQVADIASRGSAAIANSLQAASNAFLLFKASKAQSTFRLPRSVPALPHPSDTEDDSKRRWIQIHTLCP